MRVPLGWLAEWIELPASQQELTERLTLGGLEIEGIETRAPTCQRCAWATCSSASPTRKRIGSRSVRWI